MEALLFSKTILFFAAMGVLSCTWNECQAIWDPMIEVWTVPSSTQTLPGDWPSLLIPLNHFFFGPEEIKAWTERINMFTLHPANLTKAQFLFFCLSWDLAPFVLDVSRFKDTLQKKF